MRTSKRTSLGQGIMAAAAVIRAALLICTFCVYTNSQSTAAASSLFAASAAASSGESSALSAAAAAAAAAASSEDEPVALRMGSPGAGIKVEVSLDLACPISAAAWPELKQMVDDNISWTDFVFRIRPMPHHQYAFEAAKALQVVRYHAFNRGEGVLEVTSFMNHVFDGQALILNDATEDLTRLEVRQILGEWAASSGSMTIEDFDRAMVDVKFEKWAIQEFESACACGIPNTPMAVVNGVTLGLRDEKGFEEFRQVLDQQISVAISNDDDFLWMGSLSLRGRN